MGERLGNMVVGRAEVAPLSFLFVLLSLYMGVSHTVLYATGVDLYLDREWGNWGFVLHE